MAETGYLYMAEVTKFGPGGFEKSGEISLIPDDGSFKPFHTEFGRFDGSDDGSVDRAAFKTKEEALEWLEAHQVWPCEILDKTAEDEPSL